MKEQAKKIDKIISEANDILIIQADNPDGDSIGSALALEQILADMGKSPSLYCGVTIPDYLKFLEGWSRINNYLPSKIDASIIVDTSSTALLEQLNKQTSLSIISKKPVIVLDHHSDVKCDIPFASLICNRKDFSSTGELIYEIAKQNKWPLSLTSYEYIAQSILSDTLGLTSEATTANTYRRLADMIDDGLNRTKLEESRRAYSKMPPSVFRYKAELITRTEFYGNNGTIAIVTIPEEELYSVGTLYNPAPLILNEMMMTEGVKTAIVLKLYKNKITAAIRSVDGAAIAHKLAEKFDGGGHPYAAGFKLDKPSSEIVEVKSKVIAEAERLLEQ